MITAIVFDIGETVLDDTRNFGLWADWLRVPRHTFSAVLGALRARGRPTNEVFEVFRPGISYSELLLARGAHWAVTRDDLYPDVVPVLTALQDAGMTIGLAGNQSASATAAIAGLSLPVAFVDSSSTLGAEKPARRFFDRLLDKHGLDASATLYVGDNYDNDVEPARQCGLRTAFLVRGPWAHLNVHGGLDPYEADHVIHNLAELLPLVELPERT